MKLTAFICLLSLSGNGLFTPKEVAPPPEISVEKAFYDVGVGILDLKKLLADNRTVLGLVVCRVDVNFNIAAQAAAGGKVGIDVSVPLQAAKVGINASGENTSTATRGNVVQVHLGSIYSAFCGMPQVANAAASPRLPTNNPAVNPPPPATNPPPPAANPPSRSGTTTPPVGNRTELPGVLNVDPRTTTPVK